MSLLSVAPTQLLLMATFKRIMCPTSQRSSHLKGFCDDESDFTELQSPDLNPIKLLWDVVDREILIMGVQPPNQQKLCDATSMSTWSKIPEERFKFMQQKIKTVQKPKEWPA